MLPSESFCVLEIREEGWFCRELKAPYDEKFVALESVNK